MKSGLAKWRMQEHGENECNPHDLTEAFTTDKTITKVRI